MRWRPTHTAPPAIRLPATPRALASRWPVTELVGQFAMTRGGALPPWPRQVLDDWQLAVHERLPCRRVWCGGRHVGWLLGHPVDVTGGLPDAEVTLDAAAPERSIYAFGGRFAALLPGLGRVYLDPFGLLSTVYCPEQQMVASTIGLVPYDAATPDRERLIERMGLPFRNGVFPLGMTPREGIERLLPNHFLDLATWQPVRHWPERPPSVDRQPRDAVAEIAALCRAQLRGACARGPLTIRLTAGKDSRMLLACARDMIAHVDCVTADVADEMSEVDCAAARRVARLAGVPHRVLPWQPADAQALELWLYRSGCAVGEQRGWRAAGMFQRGLESSRGDVLGVGGEIGRGIWWRPGEGPDARITAERLLPHTRCPAEPEVLERLEAWLARAGNGDALQLLDLFFLEQRIGGWAGVVTYAEAPYAREQSFPLCHRRIVELMMSLPVDYRRGATLPDDVVALAWPRLSKYRYNAPSPGHRLRLEARSWGRRLKRLVADPYPALARRLRW